MFKLHILLFAMGASLADEIISFDLLSQVRQQGSVNITISFSGSSISALQGLGEPDFGNRTERLNQIYDILTETADSSQKEVLNILKKRLTTNSNTEIHRFWITNQIVIRNADASLLQAISEDPQVSSIEEEVVYKFYPVEFSFQGTINQVQWGISKVLAPEAWNYLGGRNGNGVVVGILDSGVRRSHEALRDNYLGDFGWYDPSRRTTSPNDQGGHGTHVAGTIVGSRGIGVAPGARWSACVGCPNYCPQADLVACGQFFLCPTTPDGSRRDCSKAPHIINNSWGGGRGDTSYNGVINAWRRAGIIPVFANGNDGPNCNTAESPGDNPNVIGVGATTDRDAIAGFSSLGPTTDGRIKPDVSAPGNGIVSAGHTSDGAYRTASGTSMASPHVAGVIALIKSRNIQLNFDQVRRLLVDNAEKSLSFTGRTCNGRRDNQFPNHVFGNGRVNAFRTVRAIGGGGNTKTIDFFTEQGHQGERMRFEIQDTKDCHYMTDRWNDRASSVNTDNNCIVAFEHSECRGKSERIGPGTPSHGDLGKLGMEKMISSFRLC